MLSFFKSTRKYRYSQRAVVAQEVGAGIAQGVSLPAMLPLKVSQFVTSGLSCFSSGIKVQERVLSAVESVVSGCQVGVIAALLYAQEECASLSMSTTGLCSALWILELSFQGLLLVTWVPGEFLKEEADGTSPAIALMGDQADEINENLRINQHNDHSTVNITQNVSGISPAPSPRGSMITE